VTRRRLLAAATAVAVLAALVIVGFKASSPDASPPAASKDLSGSIVVIGTGGLSWSDVSAEATPALWSLLRDGATAALTVRSVRANTCPVDGWLTLSAGERAGDVDAVGGGSGGPDGAKQACQDLPEYMTAGKVPHWSDYVAAAAATKFDASLGLLGDQVASHGGCIQAVGPGAALGAARATGIVDRYQPFDESTLASALTSCPATLTGPYFGAGTLQSPSTRQPGLAQLSDLTATALDHLSIPRPARLGGAPLQFVPGDGNDQRSALGRLSVLLDLDKASYEVHSLVEPFFYGWALLQLALYLVAAVLWRRRWGTAPQRRRLLVFTRRATTVAQRFQSRRFSRTSSRGGASRHPW